MMDSLWSPHWQSQKTRTNAAEGRVVPTELYQQPLEDTVQPIQHNPVLQTDQGSGKRYRKVKSLPQSFNGPPFQSRPVPLSTDSRGAASEYLERGDHEGSAGPVHTFVKTDKHAHFKWGVRHHVGH